MPVGDSFRSGWAAKVGVAEETTLGTFITSTAFSPVTSFNLNLSRELKRIESINGTRDTLQVFRGLDKVEGSVECHLNVSEDFCVLLLKHAMGGTVSSTTDATTTSASYVHTIYAGDTENNKATTTATNHPGLSFWAQYGETISNAWGFTGCKVNSLTLKGALGEPIVMTAELVGINSTNTTFTLTAVYGTQQPLLFNGVVIGEADNIASITSATTLKFQSFELTVANNINSDEKSYNLGSRQATVLPAGRREVSLKLSQRFDSTTNWLKFTQDTTTAIRILMDSGVTMTANVGASTYQAYVDLPFVRWTTSLPEIGDAGVLTQDLECVPYAANTTTSYAIQMVVKNKTASYQ